MARDGLGGGGYYVDLLLNSYCWIEVRDNGRRTDGGGGYHYNQYILSYIQVHISDYS